MFLLGDLNVDFLEKDSKRKSIRLLKNFATSSGPSQVINAPTRITNISQTMLDLIFVNIEHRIIDSGVIPMSISDHSLVYCTLKTGVRKASPKVIFVPLLQIFQRWFFYQWNDIENIPWHVVENETNIDDAVITWNKLFSDVADAHAPIKNRPISGNKTPWMSPKIKETMRDRDYHHRKAIRSHLNYHWNGICIESCGIQLTVKWNQPNRNTMSIWLKIIKEMKKWYGKRWRMQPIRIRNVRPQVQ